MLVLSRKEHERIYIGDFVVEVRRIQGSSVTLAVEAPRDVPVHRGEVYDAIQRSKPEGQE